MVIRILLADDHNIVRNGLRSLLEKQHDMQVIAETSNGSKTVQLVKKLKPDITIMDISMPDLNGIDATHNIINDIPNANIIALSMYSDRRFVLGMLKAGAMGYLLKDCAFEELELAIRTVINNKIYITSKILNAIIHEYMNQILEINKKLSEREHRLLKLLTNGKSTKQISSELSMNLEEIEKYMQKIIKQWIGKS